jgi:hypothetical protein
VRWKGSEVLNWEGHAWGAPSSRRWDDERGSARPTNDRRAGRIKTLSLIPSLLYQRWSRLQSLRKRGTDTVVSTEVFILGNLHPKSTGLIYKPVTNSNES